MSAAMSFVSHGGWQLLLSAVLFLSSASALSAARKGLPALPEGRAGAAAVFHDGGVIVVGGETAAGLSGAIDRLDLKTREWTRLCEDIVPRAMLAAVVVDDELFIFGGRGARGAVAEVDVFNLKTGELREGPVMPTPRWSISAANFRGEIFVAGGTFGWGRVNTVEIFDPRAEEWFVGEPLSEARDTQLVVVDSDAGTELFALGGFVSKKRTSNLVERYRAPRRGSLGAWEISGRMPHKQSAFAAASVGGRVFMLGDYRAPGTARALERRPLAKGGFDEVGVRSFQPTRHAAAVVVGDRVIVLGGEDLEGTPLDTVQMISGR